MRIQKSKQNTNFTDKNQGIENISAPEKKELFKIQRQKNINNEGKPKENEKEVTKNVDLLTDQFNQAIKQGISLVKSHLYK